MTEQRPITHAQLVRKLSKPGDVIASDLNSNIKNKVVLLMEATASIQHAMQLDIAKKQAIYNKGSRLQAGSIDLKDKTSPMVRTHLSGKQADLLHMAIGIAGEAGELLHTVMSHILNAEPIDLENLVEELGDLEFFMEGFRQNQQISRDETISQNIAKLSVRYASGSYTDDQAQLRADKVN